MRVLCIYFFYKLYRYFCFLKISEFAIFPEQRNISMQMQIITKYSSFDLSAVQTLKKKLGLASTFSF